MNYKKFILNFIDSIPDEKLQGFRLEPGTLHADDNFRLNMQGLTSSTREYNLQIQINFKVKITSLKIYAPKTIAGPAAGQTAANKKGVDKNNVNRNGVNKKNGASQKNADGKLAADQKGVKDVTNKNDGDKADVESTKDDESNVPDPDAIRKAFKATIKPLDEIMGPGQKGKQGQQGKKGKK
ncbi:hypothetical protein PGQ11_011660 [Apiospora arundinis]|uniref:Uncharacterized protein n=1 Tax=Apiospora arundinis TaxID=335852 RepID=A0ABR2I0A6_9PEZI